MRTIECGYSSDRLLFSGTHVHFGKEVIPARLGELDEAPEGVEEVRLITPDDEGVEDDGARIRGIGTPPQNFLEHGTRIFAEWTKDDAVWVGSLPSGESIVIHPATTHSLVTHKNEGSVVYGPGASGAWISLTGEPVEILEWCMPKYKNDETVEILEEDELVKAEMFWGLWRMIKQ